MSSMNLFSKNFEVIVGTYENFMIAFTIKYAEDGQFTLHSSFATECHLGSIRKMLICGQHLLTGGMDDNINIFSLKKRAQHGFIDHHNGAINDLQQHNGEFLFSASDDGTIIVHKAGSWELLRTLKGHRGPVRSLAVHPTGKMVLSVGEDRTLHTWDLAKGLKAYVLKLEKGGSIVRWSPSGSQYVVVSGAAVHLHHIDSEQAVRTCQMPAQARVSQSNILCIHFLSPTLLCCGLASGVLAVLDLEAKPPCVVRQWKAHDTRVKACAEMPTVGPSDLTYLVTASSDGLIRVWGFLKNEHDVEPVCLSEKHTQCEVTCLAVSSGADSKNSKAKSSAASVPKRAAAPSIKLVKNYKTRDDSGLVEACVDEEAMEMEHAKRKRKSADSSVKKVRIAEPDIKTEIKVEEDDDMDIITGEDVIKFMESDSSNNNSQPRKSIGKVSQRPK